MVSTNDAPIAAWRRWLETLLLATFALAAFGAFGPNNMSGAAIGVGWLVLAPALAGAQHGMLYGLVSAAVLSLTGLAAQGAPLAQLGSAVAQGWGWVFAGIGAITGFFRDVDARRYALASSRARESSQELQALERAFVCLQWSHAQLEQQFCTQPHSLAAIMDAAAERMQQLRSAEALADLILEVALSSTSVQSASLYGRADNQIARLPLASSLGAPAELFDHPLVLRALHCGRLVSIADAPSRAGAVEGVVAAIPLQSSCDQLRLMFVVHQLPFDAFGVEQLRSLHGLLARLVDLMQQRLDAMDAVDRPVTAEQRQTAASARADSVSIRPWPAAGGGEYASQLLQADRPSEPC